MNLRIKMIFFSLRAEFHLFQIVFVVKEQIISCRDECLMDFCGFHFVFIDVILYIFLGNDIRLPYDVPVSPYRSEGN